MPAEKKKILLFAFLVFVGLFLVYLEDSKVILNFWNFIFIGLIALIDVLFYPFFAPLPWVKLKFSRSFFFRFTLALLFCIIAVTAMASINTLMLRLIYHYTGKISFLLALRSNLYLHLPLMLLYGFVISGWKLAEQGKLTAEEQAIVAMKKLLQSQLSPHVMVNLLTVVAMHIHEGAYEAALDSLSNICDILRGILRASEKSRLPFGEERILIEKYLELEKTRLEKRLNYKLDWDRSLDAIELPPLLVQPLVENAIKHAISKCKCGGELVISCQKKENEINIIVKNTGLPIIEKNPSGIGLKNLKSRLKLDFNGEAQFSIQSQGDWTVAEILLNPAKLKNIASQKELQLCAE